MEIYATSIDYNPHAESSILFFKQVQNKMHWAAHTKYDKYKNHLKNTIFPVEKDFIESIGTLEGIADKH